MSLARTKVDDITEVELANICSAKTLTITPNQRTCSNLRDRAVMFKLKDKNACKVPDIQALSSWVNETFNKLRMKNISPFNKLAIIPSNLQIAYWVKAICFVVVQ